MKRINENTLAKEVVKAEGGQVNLSIAQCKEVIRLTLDRLAWHVLDNNASGVVDLVERHA